jgi:two-component system chemotaxis sensor kinase CheA
MVDCLFEAGAGMREVLAAVQLAVEGGLEVQPVPGTAALLARIKAEAAGAPKPAPAPAPRLPDAARAPASRARGTLKVDVERVDTLVELIGELLVVESMVAGSPEALTSVSRPFRNNLSQLGKISRDLQGLAMRLRMISVRWIFQKMNRLVHDTARAVGKDVALVKVGEDTEMDRGLVEQIEEPLVHLIRNAIDHGIEPRAQREAAGKPAQATVWLRAFHEGGHVVIEVADDGRGIQTEAVLKKAREKGLIAPDAVLTDSQAHQLIFAPGFSTAAQVTELSGRGVGTDVVKRNIEALRGRVSVSSQPGKGTTLRMVLPLTLAVIKGMLVVCGGERYLVPSLSIVESITFDPKLLLAVGGRGQVVNVRGALLPLLRLDEVFGVQGARPALSEGLLIILESGERRVALWVHELVTEQQLVVKPLDPRAGNHEHFSGAAILADGKVGLIVNVERLLRTASEPTLARAPRATHQGADA